MANRTKDEQLLILGLVHTVPLDAFNDIIDNTNLDVDKLCDDLEFHFRKDHNIEDADNATFISSVKDNQAKPVEDNSVPMWKMQGYASESEWTAQAYARARQPLYPAIGDQLDDLYHKGAFSAEMKAKIKKVKDDNPKPE